MTADANTSKISAEKKTLFFGPESLAAVYNSTIDKSNSALICIAVKPGLIGGALTPFLDQVRALGIEISLTSLDEVPAFFARENIVTLGRPKSDVEKSILTVDRHERVSLLSANSRRQLTIGNSAGFPTRRERQLSPCNGNDPLPLR